MKPKDYIARNLKGYEGDENIHKELSELVELHDVETIIETGTYLGGTTVRLSELADNVVTIESDFKNYNKAAKRLKDIPNVVLIRGKSQQVLSEVIKSNQGQFLFFLDAHWEKECPLLDELRIIAEAKITPVIVIHDFYVPNRPELGFDTYNGQIFDWEWIKPKIEAIYGESYYYYYNDKADGAMRGVIYIEPA